MKKLISALCFTLFLLSTIQLSGQFNLPRGSQMAKVSQRVGTTDITIKYSRPKVNDREIWGKLVPYGLNNLGFGTSTAAPWRAGANENTTISFTHDVEIEGQDLSAGTYGLHLIVNEGNEATLILSHDYSAWGSYFYDQANDAIRVDITTREAPHHEMLTYKFTEVDATSALASLVWEKKEFPFKITVPVTEIVMEDWRQESRGQQGFNRQNWENAARFALNNGGDPEEALEWIDKAIQGQFFSQKNFNNLAIKAQLLKKMGKQDEYLALVDEAAGMANMNQLNAIGYQLLADKDYDLALKYFKQNVENNPTVANVHDSLGEAYMQAGDKENAIKSLKKALSLNPPPNVKANSRKIIKRVGSHVSLWIKLDRMARKDEGHSFSIKNLIDNFVMPGIAVGFCPSIAKLENPSAIAIKIHSIAISWCKYSYSYISIRFRFSSLFHKMNSINKLLYPGHTLPSNTLAFDPLHMQKNQGRILIIGM